MSLQGAGRSWGPKGDAGFCLCALHDAELACQVQDVLAAHDSIGFALDCLGALAPESGEWLETGDLARMYLVVRSAVVSRPAAPIVQNALSVTAERVVALHRRLTVHIEDVRVVAVLAGEGS